MGGGGGGWGGGFVGGGGGGDLEPVRMAVPVWWQGGRIRRDDGEKREFRERLKCRLWSVNRFPSALCS